MNDRYKKLWFALYEYLWEETRRLWDEHEKATCPQCDNSLIKRGVVGDIICKIQRYTQAHDAEEIVRLITKKDGKKSTLKRLASNGIESPTQRGGE